uniref:Uncharacterized protein n=1 Tax=Geladintestivirus 4 TaxID=3233136 RepID=A0AAU8MKK7_9CAUD
MACILINGEVQSTFTIKDLEKAIRDICSKDNGIDTLPISIGFKTIIPEENVGFICPSQIQEDVDKEIINSLHSYKPFSKYLSNE